MEDALNLGAALNWRQVVRELGCSKSYFYRLVDEGAFPNAYRLGSKGIRVPSADVAAFKMRMKVAEQS
jgi:excisionase family DNA binding protein